MGTISSALSSYYQLANLTSSGSGTSGFGTTGSAASSSPTQTLAQALDAAESSSSGSGASSYLLDLSPAAQSLLGGNSSTTSSGSGSSTDFSLTKAQQTTIKNILEKYKDAPVTQATFNAIQTALQAAGLSPETLGAEDQIQSFNSTNTLLTALNGGNIDIQNPGNTAASEQTKESNYMQSIANLWKSEDTSGTSSASGTSAVA